MTETGYTIQVWAEQTFGVADSDVVIWDRAHQEMIELLERLDPEGDKYESSTLRDAAEECADVVIVLAQIAARQGWDIFDMVDQKMRVNRARKWKVNSKGVGQHV